MSNEHPCFRHANRKRPADAMLRQWVMLKLIPQEPAGITVNQIRQHLALANPPYDVHRRTIERNLAQLMSIFPELDYREDAGGNQWFWDCHTVVDLTRLKEPECTYHVEAVPAEPRDAILRQWVMLKIIARERSGITSRQLQSRLAQTDPLYEVELRTIERNLAQLRGIFPELGHAGDGNKRLWCWTSSPHANIPGL